MPPNRDTVAESYLQRIYTETLNAMYNFLDQKALGENWVRVAMEHRMVTEEAVKRVMKGKYSEKVVTWSSNTDATMKATDAGYQVLHSRSLGKNELKNMRELGGLKSANEVFGKKQSDDPDVVEPEEIQKKFALWVREIGLLAGKKVTPVFIRDKTSNQAANCTMNTENPTMRFNTHHLDTEFFKGRDAEQLDLIIHELGPSEMNGTNVPRPKMGRSMLPGSIPDSCRDGKIEEFTAGNVII